MTHVTVERKDGAIVEVTAKGHSGYAKQGKDIVCASISATVQTALLGLIKFSPQKVDYTVGEDGYIKFSVPRTGDDITDGKLQAIAETMVVGIKDIESGYGSYVKLEEK